MHTEEEKDVKNSEGLATVHLPVFHFRFIVTCDELRINHVRKLGTYTTYLYFDGVYFWNSSPYLWREVYFLEICTIRDSSWKIMLDLRDISGKKWNRSFRVIWQLVSYARKFKYLPSIDWCNCKKMSAFHYSRTYLHLEFDFLYLILSFVDSFKAFFQSSESSSGITVFYYTYRNFEIPKIRIF